jgi:hypothetical protein
MSDLAFEVEEMERARQERQEKIDSMKDFLLFLETHPDFPVPVTFTQQYGFFDTKKELVAITRQLGKVKKVQISEYYSVEKSFGLVSYTAYIAREKVCRAVVTGKRWVQGRIVNPHEEDVVEWICDDPLLKPNGGTK